MKKIRILALVFSICAACSINFGQTPTSPTAADELFKEQKWSAAAKAYEEILRTEPDNKRALYQLGMARYSLKQYAPAADAFERNIAKSDNPSVMYNLACVYALLNEREKAVEWLTKSVNHPKMILAAVSFDDPDLAAVKNDTRVKALAEKIERQTQPCKYSAESRQFDFFVGEWDAFNPQGNKGGTSVIQKISGDCAVLENWTNAFGGGGGKSINFYDAANGKWYQYWIGQDGNPARFSGTYKDGAMRFEGEPFMQNGKRVLSRLTFFNLDANTVRQLAEQSVDDGKTWITSYDFKYVRRK